MNQDIIAAVFPTHSDANRAIEELRRAGVPDTAISVVASSGGQTQMSGDVAHSDHHDGDDKVSGTLKGAAVGAGVGALFGLAALMIPGVGPFITAGALANALGTAGGAAAAGAIVGGTAGGVAGLLEDYGVKDEDARYYAGQIEQGGVFVGVNTMAAAMDPGAVRQVFQTCGGRMGPYMA